MRCRHCGCENDDDAQFCKRCGKHFDINNIRCPRCGVELKNPVVFCPRCGEKIIGDKTKPKEEPKLTEFDEEIKKQEIERLIKVNRKTFKSRSSLEPKVGILTDEEILKYSPDSTAAQKIKFKNADSLFEKITAAPDLTFTVVGVIFLICFFLFIWSL